MRYLRAPDGTELIVDRGSLKSLPRFKFPGCVKLVSTSQDEHEAIANLSHERIIGFDSESKIRAPNESKTAPCLLQLSSHDFCYIWRVSAPSIPFSVRSILESDAIVKVSQGAIGEVTTLASSFTDLEPRAFLCIYNLATSLRCLPRSLHGLVGIFLKRNLDKSLCTSDWSSPILSEAQLEYAATDAFAALQVLLAMRAAFKVDVLPQEILIDSTALGFARPGVHASLRL